MTAAFAVLLLLGGAEAAAAPLAHLPVVVVPGFMGWDRLPLLERYCEGACATFEERGHDVTVVQSSAIAGSEDRAAAVVATVSAVVARTGKDRVVVVAHSQGGLDVRMALRTPGFKEKVGAVVTLSTPHHGTPVATLASRAPVFLVDAVLNPVQWLWESFEPMDPARRRAAASAASLRTLALTDDGRLLFQQQGALTPFEKAAAVDDAARDARAVFARDGDAPEDGVAFFSVAGVTEGVRAGDRSCEGGRWSLPRVADDVGVLMLPGRVAHAVEGWWLANDGIVPAASARHGVFLGCVAADHIDWLGWHAAANGEGPVFDEDEFLAVVVEGLEAAAADGAGAMDAFVPRLAALAAARPVD